MSKKIVILGAGYAGVHAAKLLHKKYKKNNDVSITLIDKNPYHTLMTDLHEVAGSRISEDGVKVNLNKIFKEKKVDVVVDYINDIDFENNVLKSEKYSYDYDYLVMGTGAEPAFFGVDGAEDNSFTLWSLEDAIEIREHIETMFERAKNEKNLEKRKRMLTFIVAGGGFTGVEMVGELAEWKDKLCDKYDVKPRDVSIKIVEGLPGLLPILTEKLSNKAERRLNKMGVDVITDAFIGKVGKDHIETADGNSIPTNTLIWTCGVQGNSFAKETDLTIDRSNRIETNDYMQSVDYENVYLVGDNAFYVEEGEEKPVPQIVETALQTAETVVENIDHDIAGKEKEEFESNYHGFMVSIGSRYAVANVGGMSLSGFPAMAVKHLVNLHYLWGVGGFALIWSYLMHEIFHIEDKRSLLGSHFSKSTPNFWLMPLRVFIGVHWLLEGIKKVQDGWLEPGNIYIIQTAADSGATAADATEYASEPLLESVPGFYQWIMDTLIAPVAFPMQAMVVFLEIAIGLALIAGLLTFLMSLASIFLTFNFILSAMAGPEILWYTFGSIALLGGAGRALGLDYYVMPWLKKKWKNSRFARKSYLYIE